jgi:hypothetical protein
MFRIFFRRKLRWTLFFYKKFIHELDFNNIIISIIFFSNLIYFHNLKQFAKIINLFIAYFEFLSYIEILNHKILLL